MNSKSLSTSLAEFVSGAKYEQFPFQVVERAKTCILDMLSSAYAGRNLPWIRIAVDLVKDKPGDCTVISYEHKVPAMDAALANGAMGHSVVREDTIGAAHPMAEVMPAVIATAEQENASGTDFLTALILGYEIEGRLSLRCTMGSGLHPGFRPGSVLGPLGAAVGVGKLLKFDTTLLVHTIGFAANMSSGITEAWWPGAMDVMFQTGLAARNGILAATLAGAGATSSATALDGRDGFFRAFTGSNQNLKVVTADLGKRFMILETTYKPYPICYFALMPLDITLSLKEQYKITAGDIDKVIERAPTVADLAPNNGFTGPFDNNLQAQMSAPFSIAAALLGKPVRMPSFFAEHYNDPEILQMAQKVKVIGEDDRKLYRMEIYMKDGKEYTLEEDISHKLIPTREELEARFMEAATSFLGVEKAADILDTIMNLDKVDNIRSLTGKLYK